KCRFTENKAVLSGNGRASSTVDDDRTIGEFVAMQIRSRKMPFQVGAHGANAGHDARLEVACPESRFHLVTDPLPGFGSDQPVYTAIGDDLDVPIREQEVNQDAVVPFSVPDAEIGKHFQ